MALGAQVSGYTITEVAEAQAIGLCLLARQRGLPPIHSLRAAAAQLHPERCGWCDFPIPELLRMLEARSVSEWAEKEWWAMPGRSRLRAIELAQGAGS
jgi:hypothetical protein